MLDQKSKPNMASKKPGPFLRLVLFLAALAMVLIAVALVAFRNTLNLDAIQRWFTYQSLVLSDSGQAESFHYDGQVSDCFAALDEDLLVCSQNDISIYSASGARYVEQPVSMEHPVVDTAGGLAVAYDAGGSSLYILGQRELIWSVENLETILAAHLNRQGQLTVVTQQSGYRGAVTVYSAAHEALMSVRIHSAFVMDAALSDNGRTLAIITVGADTGDFTTTLSLYTLNSAAGALDEPADYTPDLTVDLGGNVALGMRCESDLVWVLGERGISVAGHGGDTVTCDWADPYLKLYDLSGEGFAAALLGKYRAGSQATLQVVNRAGEVSASLPVNEQVLSMSAAGRYLALLTGDRLDIYTSELTLYASLDGSQGARKVVLREDGSAILISAEQASFYIPA